MLRAMLSSIPPPRWPSEREIRYSTGVVLFIFAFTHFLNHALGIFGYTVMEAAQHWRMAVWRSWPGTVLLYGSFIIHPLLALKRMVLRRTWRMPLNEAVQIVLGLLIPVLIAGHLIGTRIESSFWGLSDSYRAVLGRLWPDLFWSQTVLLLVVWTHAMIGLRSVAKSKTWYPLAREAGLVLAILTPLLAIAGFVSVGREVAAAGFPAETFTDAQISGFNNATRYWNFALLGFSALIVAIAGFRELHRRRAGRISIRYIGHGDYAAAKGLTVLEVSRIAGVPHPSICGGRGRCSTCRVLVSEGAENLLPPDAAERLMLERISAPPNVRLACQIRPTHDLGVRILLPASKKLSLREAQQDSYRWGVQLDVTVLFVDIRAFTSLLQRQAPHELVALLNRVLNELSQAVVAHGGRVDMLLSDGLMAVFGINSTKAAGARASIMAARDMLRTVRSLNREYAAALPMPLRVGIGIHTGAGVAARIGDADRGWLDTVLGETVSIASKLEAATKHELADCLISQETLSASALVIQRSARKEVHIQGREEPLIAYALNDKLETEAA